MLAEFIDRIRGLAHEADSIQFETHDLLPEKVFLRQGNGVTEHEVRPPYRVHQIGGYSDLVRAMNDEGMVPGDAEIFHNHLAVVAHLDREDRRETLSLGLVQSERWKKLVDLRTGWKGGVREVVKMLRFDLHSTGTESVLRALSRVDFTRKSDGGANVDHGRESLGKSVEAAVQQADSIPETFMVTCSVYTNPGFRDLSQVQVACGVYLDMQNDQIEIRTLSDEIEAGMNAAQAAIAQKLAEDLPAVPSYFGAP